MELQTYSIGYIPEDRTRDIISKIGTLALIGEIGASRKEVARFFGVSTKTISRILQGHSSEFSRYGEYIRSGKEIRALVGDKSVHHKTKEMYLFNRKQVMLFACYLNHSSEVAKRIVHYLIEAESLVGSETRLDALLMSLVHWNDLSSEEKPVIYMQVMDEIRKAKPLVSFAESVGDTENLISIGDFAKTTKDSLGLGRNKLFQEMRYDGILGSGNIPYQNYINSGYFRLVTRIINGECIHQPLLTGKGQLWLYKRMRKTLGI